MKLQFYLSLEYKVEHCAWFILSNDLGALFEEGFLHMILNLVIELFIKIFFQILSVKVINMLQEGDFELFPFIFVFVQAILPHIH